MFSLQPHPPPTLIFHGLYGGILQVSPVAYSYLVAKYQMSSGPYGPIFDGSNSYQTKVMNHFCNQQLLLFIVHNLLIVKRFLVCNILV